MTVLQPGLQQLLAVSALIVTCERIASSGILSEADEFDLRILIVRAGKAFGMDTLAERPASNVVHLHDIGASA